jgi:capsular exopolysaccharide synthesis family protein
VAVFVMASALFYLRMATPLYRAKALIELSVRRPRILTQQAAVIDDATAAQSEEIFRTRLEKLRGAAILGKVVARLQSEPAAQRIDADFLRAMLARKVRLTLLRLTRLVQVEFDDPDPAFAAAVCNAFAEIAEKGARDENRVVSDAAVDWLEAQAAAQRKELEASDQALLRFRQEHNLDALATQRRTVEDALLGYNKALVQVQTQAAAEEDMLKALTALRLKPESVGSVPADAPRAEEMKNALAKWLAAVVEQKMLQVRYTAQHPDVIHKQEETDLYRGQAIDALQRSRDTSAGNLALLRKEAERLTGMKAEQSQLASQLDLKIAEGTSQLATLQRAHDACDTAYRGILQRIQEARLAADEMTALVKVAERAAVPKVPVYPQPLLVLALATAIGVCSGIGLALLVEQLDDRLTGNDDLDALEGLKTVAFIPHERNGTRFLIARSTIRDQFSPIAEAFAGLRLTFETPPYRTHAHVILVASSIPEEGKTIASCNLAEAFARSEQSTLLVDFDLRRPRLGDIFPIPENTPGLLEYLMPARPACPPETLAYAVADCPRLDVVAGRLSDEVNPAELLAGRRLVEFMAWARAQYAHVIIDAPPLGLVNDALALSAHADAVVVVARLNHSGKRMVRRTALKLLEARVGLVVAVVNDVDVTRYGDYAYAYSYYSRDYWRGKRRSTRG